MPALNRNFCWNSCEKSSENICLRTLKMGPVPKHVAIIMDGHRRFARKLNLASETEGHRMGEANVFKCISLALELGIPELSIFSFSEDNYKRTPAEVKHFLKMTKCRVEALLEKTGEFKQTGVRWDVVSNWDYVPSGIRKMFAKCCVETKDGRNLNIHIQFVYKATKEICGGISCLVEGIADTSLRCHDLNQEMFQESISNVPSYPVDILIRTGGDCRISDYLLWQASSAYFEFIDAAWPEMTTWHMFRAILQYQQQVLLLGQTQYKLNATEKENQRGYTTSTGNEEDTEGLNRRQMDFINRLREFHWECVENFANDDSCIA